MSTVATAGTHSTVHVTISGFTFPYNRWQPGYRLRGRLLAIDTETAPIDEYEVPPLALATAAGDRGQVLIHPDDLSHFILAHSDCEFVCHNVAFDFWVIHEHLSRRNETQALDVWKNLVMSRRLHDTMLLDILLRLAEDNNENNDAPTVPRNLAEVVLCYTGLEVSKEDPYRLRFGEIIGRDWNQVDPRFFEYAIKDPITTLLAYREMGAKAHDCMMEHGFDQSRVDRFSIYPDAIQRFGLLSESIQVEGAIALSQITRYGLHTDTQWKQAAASEYQRQLDPLIHEFVTNYPGILKQDRQGQLVITESGQPSKSTGLLKRQLERVIDEICINTLRVIKVPQTEKGKTSLSLDAWSSLIDYHPFLRLWSDFEKLVKRRQFFAMFNKPVIHPRYTVMVKTGRTSCSNPNLQQIPREDAFRQIIVPSPGHLLLSVDYSFIELVTLAAVCQARFGFSHLGDVIRQGIDPHCYTAAMLVGISLSDFMNLKDSDKDRFKLARQQAKPVNFGVPGGMGPVALVEYARATYGVTLSQQQAEHFYHQLTTVIYPELGHYLADTGMAYLAGQLHVPEPVCRDTFGFGNMTPSTAATIVRKIVAGNPQKADGTPYKADFVCRVWDDLNALNRNPELSADLQRRVGNPQFTARLFDMAAVTLTGRIRGNTTYTQQRNTPFQSLASDGAKRALGRLVLAGYRVVGFVHDEILVELPDQGGYVDRTSVEDVVTIMRDAMQEMVGDLPVGCEYTLSTCWSKSADLIVNGDKILPWRPNG